MSKVFIIAEAGVNHNGSLKTAKEMVCLAAEAGADAIKFQTFRSESLLSKTAQKADYQKEQTGSDESQLDMIKKLELSFDSFVELQSYCKEKGILFLSTPFDFESIDFLAALDMPIFKVPSGEVTNLPHLLKIASFKKPVILSTGMCTMEEVEYAVNVLTSNGAADLTLLHCNTQYPTPFSDVNLKAMLSLKNKFGLKIGYSDHTLGIEVPIAAAALGSEVIEKHFTLDHSMDGPDHKASLEPRELKAMVRAIRNIEAALGDGIKRVTASERNNIVVARKSIVAKKDIKTGDVFTTDNITVKRPGNGISPTKWFDVIGNRAKKNFSEDELIEI